MFLISSYFSLSEFLLCFLIKCCFIALVRKVVGKVTSDCGYCMTNVVIRFMLFSERHS